MHTGKAKMKSVRAAMLLTPPSPRSARRRPRLPRGRPSFHLSRAHRTRQDRSRRPLPPPPNQEPRRPGQAEGFRSFPAQMGRGGQEGGERAHYEPPSSSTGARSSVPTAARDSLVRPAVTAATAPGPRAPPQPPVQGRPPTPRCLPPWVPGQLGNHFRRVTDAFCDAREISTWRGGDALNLSPTSVHGKCAGPSRFLQHRRPARATAISANLNQSAARPSDSQHAAPAPTQFPRGRHPQRAALGSQQHCILGLVVSWAGVLVVGRGSTAFWDL